MVTDHIRQAKTHLKEYYGEAEGEKYMARLAAGASAHALLAIHDLLADALASPETALRASESDATPAKGSPEDPPTPESPREDDSDQALANVLLFAHEASRGPGGLWVDADWHALARAAREHIEDEREEGGYNIRRAQRAIDRAQKAEAERDEFNGFWKDALADVRKARDERDAARHAGEALAADRERLGRERNGWKAKHAALRADVERHRGQCAENADDTTASYGYRGRCAHTEDTLKVILRSDAARDPSGDHHEVGSKCQRDHCEETHEPDADTVTLRRDDVGMMLADWEEWLDGYATEEVAALRLRVRAALGWGDEA